MLIAPCLCVEGGRGEVQPGVRQHDQPGPPDGRPRHLLLRHLHRPHLLSELAPKGYRADQQTNIRYFWQPFGSVLQISILKFKMAHDGSYSLM